jgi:P-type E1-E2 ATPase
MQKEAQFRVIEEREKEFCVVVRNGQEIETVSEDILIGDIVVLKQGDSIVADGVFISGTDLQLDEAAITGEAEGIRKDFEHPFLLSGTSVLDGEGVMLVIAIGVNSTRGQISALVRRLFSK